MIKKKKKDSLGLECSRSFKEEILYTEVTDVNKHLQRPREASSADVQNRNTGIYLDVKHWL